MLNPYDLVQAQCQLALLQAALVRYSAPWLKNAKVVLRDESGQFASQTRKATGSPPSIRVRTGGATDFPLAERFQDAEMAVLKTSAGSSNYSTTEIDGKKYFLKRRNNSSFADAAAKEELATEVAKIMGIEKHVIPSKRMKIKGRDYSVSPFTEGENLFETDKTVSDLLTEKEITKLGLFDFVIANGDRNEGNLYVTQQGLKLADHEATFTSLGDFEGELADAFRDQKNKITKQDIQSVVDKQDKLLKAIEATVEDKDLAKMYTKTVRGRLGTLQAIADSPDIGKAIDHLMS
jgi:hypothetical protein